MVTFTQPDGTKVHTQPQHCLRWEALEKGGTKVWIHRSDAATTQPAFVMCKESVDEVDIAIRQAYMRLAFSVLEEFANRLATVGGALVQQFYGLISGESAPPPPPPPARPRK